MRTSHLFIYVPGLGDTNLDNRQKLLSLWRIRRIKVEICAMKWGVDEPWKKKLHVLLTLIDKRAGEGYVISLIGESAGASAAMQAFVQKENSLRSLILLCGKSQHPESMSKKLIARHPALESAVKESNKVIQKLSDPQKAKILNLHPLFDPVVPVKETKISGVKHSRMPIVGHATSIVFANIFWMWRIIRFAKRLK
jgi:hypothetical protein